MQGFWKMGLYTVLLHLCSLTALKMKGESYLFIMLAKLCKEWLKLRLDWKSKRKVQSFNMYSLLKKVLKSVEKMGCNSTTC